LAILVWQMLCLAQGLDSLWRQLFAALHAVLQIGCNHWHAYCAVQPHQVAQGSQEGSGCLLYLFSSL
jgi:hypothetical protein